MLSTGKSPGFLPVGKDFTIPARNFLPVGKGVTSFVREDDKTSFPTPAAVKVRAGTEVGHTDVWLNSAVPPPQPCKG